MTGERWQHIEAIVHDALERVPGERVAFVRDTCGSDDTLRSEVESLLANASAAADSRLGIRDSGLGISRVDLIGKQIGVYRILSLLGAGGMGEVYRARDTKLGRDVAIKALPAAFTFDPDRRARIEREARMLASFNHPNIGGIHGFVEQGEVLYLDSNWLKESPWRSAWLAPRCPSPRWCDMRARLPTHWMPPIRRASFTAI